MKKKILLIISVLTLILLLPLVGCNKKHTHTYEDTYSYDEGGHFYKSTCEHDLKKGYSAHIYKDSIVNPTYEEKGYTLHTCTVCGYSYKDTYTDALLKTYDITYNLDGGINSDSNPASYNKESDTITLASPTKLGYRFLGWTTDTITTPTKDLTIEKGSEGDKTFTANFEVITYSISYKLNGGTNNSSNPTTYTVEDTITLKAPTKDDYTFTGWTTDTITTPTKDLTIEKGSVGDKTFTANFGNIAYDITYILDGGTNNISNPASYDKETDTITLKDPTKVGYTFTGWTTDTITTPKKNLTIEKGSKGNKTFTANFEVITYDITYNLNGGTNGENNPTTYTIESDDITLENPTKSGYTFTGWTNDEITTPNKDITIVSGSNGNKTFTANFEATTYDITYNLNGGINNDNNPDTYTIEDSISLENPTKDGYTFKGWKYNSEYVATIDTSICANITLEAIWELTNYTITYNLDGGTNNINNPTTYTIESDDITLENPTKSGYTFTGWTNDEITTPDKNITIVNGSNGNKTFTANYEANTYTVTLDTTGYTYTGTTSYTVVYGESYKFDVISENLGGKQFKGWEYNGKQVTTSTGYVESWNIDSNVTLTPLISLLYTYTDSTKTSLYFGSYPQTKVSDTTTISNLNTKAGTLPTSTNTYLWTDYGYYISNSISSYMYYIDIDEDSDGDYDYRGVYFTSYRPFYTTSSSSSSNTYQDDNGYNTNTVYWFKYEPIKWNILKTENNKALIISNLILDSQNYYYTKEDRSGATDYQGNSTTDNVYANNYMYSHIRSWLNTTFYDTAFSTLEKQIIKTTTVDNSASSTLDSSNSYACSNTNDYIFLLSYSEATTYYSSNTLRVVQGSDYAKSQGLCVSTSSGTSGNSYYWFRSPTNDSKKLTNYVYYDGSIVNNYVHATSSGVRATCWINL